MAAFLPEAQLCSGIQRSGVRTTVGVLRFYMYFLFIFYNLSAFIHYFLLSPQTVSMPCAPAGSVVLKRSLYSPREFHAHFSQKDIIPLVS